MATTTSNLGLTKPLGTEQYDVNVFNNNADLVDAEFGAAGGHAHTGVAGDGSQLGTSGLQDLAVTTAKLADAAVTGVKLGSDVLQDVQFQNLLTNGDFESWSAGSSSAPDGFTLSGAGAAVAREGTTVKRGSYSAKVTRAGTDCHLSRDVVAAAGGTGYIAVRTFTFGAWLFATAPNRVRLRVDDGVSVSYSAYHTGGSTWEWLTLTSTLAASPTKLEAGLRVDSGDTAGFIDGGMLVESKFAAAFQPHPNDEHLRAVNYQNDAPTNFVYGRTELQWGRAKKNSGGSPTSTMDLTISFPVAYRGAPKILGNGISDTGGTPARTKWVVVNISTTGFTLRWHTVDLTNLQANLDHLADWAVIGVV